MRRSSEFAKSAPSKIRDTWPWRPWRRGRGAGREGGSRPETPETNENARRAIFALAFPPTTRKLDDMGRNLIYALATSVLTALVLIGVLFANFSNLTELKNAVRSVEAVRYVQNLIYHWRIPPVSAAAVGDGKPVGQITLFEPASVAEGPDGSLYISDRKYRIWKVRPDGIAHVLAGNGYKGSIDVSVGARLSKLGRPQGLAVDPQGRVYFADSYNDLVARVNERGVLEVVAGTGVRGFDGDEGPATELKLNKPYDVAVDGEGNVYIIDTGNHRLRKVTSDGFMSTLVGAGESGPSRDPQPAETASLHSPWGVFVDAAGLVYICDGGTHLVRRLNRSGTIETIAGIGTPGYSGDGGPARQAQLNAPEAVFVRSDGSFLIEDEFNNVIRFVDRDGTISTLLGTGEPNDRFDPADGTHTGLNDPEDVIERRDGSILVTDHLNRRIISVQADGSLEIYAGMGTAHGIGGTEAGLPRH